MADLRVVRAVLPAMPLPTEEETPQIPDELLKRFPELIQFNDDFKVFYRDLRSFTLELHRLLTENLSTEDSERANILNKLENLEDGG